MKYFVMLLTAVSIFAGCSDGAETLGGQNKGKERPEVTVNRTGVVGSEVRLSVAASEDAAQYGYVVLSGEEPATPSAFDILTNAVTGTVARGVFNYADAASTQANVRCETDIAYTIFAAAINANGLVSTVEAVKFGIDDTTGPEASSFQVLSGNSLVVNHGNESEIFFNTAGLEATVRYTKQGTSKVEGQMVISSPVQIPRSGIVINGWSATFTVALQPGATFLVDYPAGFFVDAAGNPSKESRNIYNSATDDFTAAHGNTPAQAFAILPANFEIPGAGTDWSAEGASITFRIGRPVYDAGLTNPVRVAYNEADGLKYLNAQYTLEVEGAISKVTVFLPRPPQGKFDVDIAEGAFFDEYANPTAAFRMAPDQFRYEQVILLQTGRHLVDYRPLTDFISENIQSVVSGTPFTIGLQPFDADKGLYMIGTTWLNIYSHPFVNASANTVINPVLLGQVDYSAMTITFDGRYLDPRTNYTTTVKKPDGTDDNAYGTVFYVDNLNASTQGLMFHGGGEDGLQPIVITFDATGKLISISRCGFDVRNLDQEGTHVIWYDAIWETGTLTYSPN